MIKLILLAVVPFMTQHRNVVPKTEVSTNFYGSVTGIVDKAYIEAHVGAGGGGGCDTNEVADIANFAISTNEATANLSARLAEKMDNNDGPVNVGTGWGLIVNDIPFLFYDRNGDFVFNGKLAGAAGDALNGKANLCPPSASGNLAALTEDGNLADSGKSAGELASVTNPIPFYVGLAEDNTPNYFKVVNGFGDILLSIGPAGDLRIRNSYRTISSDMGDKVHYRANEEGESDSNEIAVKGDIADAISATNPTFSDAVLAVGLNIDTNSVAVLNEIAATFGGFPIEGTATTIGGLLVALAAAIAWLKKNKVQTLKLNDDSVETSADGGVAKLDDFFTESNTLLNGRLVYERNATGLKDRAFNTLSFDGTEYNLSTALAAVTPTASGQPRDLLIVATATAATTISFTAGTIKGDKPTIDGSGTWLITLTEYASGVWYCRQIKMEDAA